jgi:hypothetical protein
MARFENSSFKTQLERIDDQMVSRRQTQSSFAQICTFLNRVQGVQAVLEDRSTRLPFDCIPNESIEQVVCVSIPQAKHVPLGAIHGFIELDVVFQSCGLFKHQYGAKCVEPRHAAPMSQQLGRYSRRMRALHQRVQLARKTSALAHIRCDLHEFRLGLFECEARHDQHTLGRVSHLSARLDAQRVLELAHMAHAALVSRGIESKRRAHGQMATNLKQDTADKQKPIGQVVRVEDLLSRRSNHSHGPSVPSRVEVLLERAGQSQTSQVLLVLCQCTSNKRSTFVHVEHVRLLYVHLFAVQSALVCHIGLLLRARIQHTFDLYRLS